MKYLPIILFLFSSLFSQINDDKEHVVSINIKYGPTVKDTVIDIQYKRGFVIFVHRNLNESNRVMIKDNITDILILN